MSGQNGKGRITMKDDPDLQPERLHPISARKLIKDFPELKPVVVDGLLRLGETCNIISASKVGKSFLSLGLAWSVATGRTWLGFDTVPGKVLIFDNELHPETLSHRLDNVAHAMQIDQLDREQVHVLSLRGRGVAINALGAHVDIESGTYSLVIFDALYRAIPGGMSENDNAAMMGLYNSLDHYASEWNSSIAVIHHSSKGDQSGKSVTDVGSGAGSVSRAADTHIVIRPHETDGYSVMDAVCRSFAPPEPQTIAYEWPVWTSIASEPVVKRANSQAANQAKKDAEADQAIRDELVKGPRSVAELRSRTGMGNDRIVRSIKRIGASAKSAKSKRTGKRTERFFLTPTV